MSFRVWRAIETRIGAENTQRWEERLRRILAPGTQSRKAADYWSQLSDCEAYYTDPIGKVRSQWVAEQIELLNIDSLLEIGCNAGRNLAEVLNWRPSVTLRGIDVNAASIEFARRKSPGVDFAVVDANQWSEGRNSWDAILTMSLIDHIPNEAVEQLARNMVATARKYLVCVELWDGSDGWRGLYKYSRDLRKLFEPLGVRTIKWERSVGQYHSEKSPLWAYIGEIGDTIRPSALPRATTPKASFVTAGGKDYPIQLYTDEEGRAFRYVHIPRPHTGRLLIHFTAFFGDWGDRKAYKEHYQGYFHRLRMFGDDERYSSLFLCDEYGHTSNGTYYTGERGDFYVERAMERIIARVLEESACELKHVVTAGSSMGATASLKFGLKFNVGGIVAVSPHIDLDAAAEFQGRSEHVAFIVPDGDPLSAANHVYTRQVRNAVLHRDTATHPLPRLYMHACADDSGVYNEQVVPLVTMWRQKAGAVDLDIHPAGGHTSDFATKEVLRDVVSRLMEGESIEPLLYRQRREFWPKIDMAEQVSSDQPAGDADSGELDLRTVLKTNDQMVALLIEFLIDRVLRQSGALPILVFPDEIDDAVLAIVRSELSEEAVEAAVLVPASGGDKNGARLVSPDGADRPFSDTSKPLLLVLKRQFCKLDRAQAQALLTDLPEHVKQLVIVDQIDNWAGESSEVRTFRDSADREYRARCHDFGNLLKSNGFFPLIVQPVPKRRKNLTGCVVAERASGADQVDEIAALRTFWQKRRGFDLRRFRGVQAGQFLVPSCSEGGVRIRAYLRNTVRIGEPFPPELRQGGMVVELRVFRHGTLIFHDPVFARIPLDGVQEISDQTCSALAGDQNGILVVARCMLPSDGPEYFGQEHLLRYQHAKSGSVATLLYDQLPIITESRDYSPIVLLAPKAWVGKHHNTYVVFASTNSSMSEGTQASPLDVTILDTQGNEVVSERVNMRHNSAWTLDVARALGDRITREAVPQFFNVVAKGGASSFAIVTLVVNEDSGNLALEHSLSPHYYVSGDLGNVRREALSHLR